MTLPQKNSNRIKMHSSQLMILVSFCWQKNFILNNAYNCHILSLVYFKLLIVGVAFFLGHPVYCFSSMRYYSKRFTVYYYPSHHWIQYQSCTHSAPSQLPGEHSGQVPLQERTHGHIKKQITFEFYQVPIYTPGWRAAMWIKCLAERRKVPGIDGNQTRNPLIQSQGFNPIYHGTSTYLYYIYWLPNYSRITRFDNDCKTVMMNIW